MSAYEDRLDFFARMTWLIDSIEVRRGEFLKMHPQLVGEMWGRLHVVHDQLEEIAVEIDLEVRKARGEKVGPRVGLGTFARDLFGDEPVMGLAEITAEVHEAIDKKKLQKGSIRDHYWFVTDSGREYILRRSKSPHREATYVVDHISETAST